MSTINSIFEIMAYFTQHHYSQSFNIIKTFNIIMRNLHIRSAEGTDVDFFWHIFITFWFFWHCSFFSVSENKKLKGAKREKEILFGGKAPANDEGDFDVFKKQSSHLPFLLKIHLGQPVIIPIKEVFYPVQIPFFSSFLNPETAEVISLNETG